MQEDNPVRKSLKHRTGGVSKTRQSDALQSDINSVLSRYVTQGYVMGNNAPPKYGDFSSGISYHDAMSRVTEAQMAFEHLPAHVKKHCRQDPGEFLDMVYDPERRDELLELGLLEEQLPDEPVRVVVEGETPEVPAPEEPPQEPEA